MVAVRGGGGSWPTPTTHGPGYNTSTNPLDHGDGHRSPMLPRSPGATASGLPTNMALASDAQIEAFIRSNYGYMAAFMDVPEVKTALFNAARMGYDEQRLYGEITKTTWWKTTDAANRTWTKLQGEDPAEARRQVEQTAATVMNRARTLGLPPGNVASIALQATKNGWNTDQQIDALIRQVNWGTIEAGDLTATRDSVRAIAGDYLVGVSDTTAQQYATRIASGEMSMDGVASAMRQQAKARFGWMASELDQGMTVKDYLAPVRDVIASELEVAPESVNLMDSKWLSMVETRGDDGKPRAATLNEAMLAARAKPEWQSTKRAQEMTTGTMKMITNIFGRSSI